jgi:heptaprenyl diphosphate synthase
VFTALSIVFGILENFVGLPVFGLRLGLANIGVMLAVLMLDTRAVIAVAFLKALIVPLVTGNFLFRFSLSLPATLVSAFFMLTYFKICAKFITPVSMGALGGFTHITVQFIAANALYLHSPALFGLLPYFAALSVLTGTVTGYLTARLSEYLINGAGKDVSENNTSKRLSEKTGADDENRT